MTLRLLLPLSFAIALTSFAQQTPQQIADAELPSLLTNYKTIHTHPELSTQEQRTSALLAKELKAVGCEVTENVGKYENADQKCYGVVGLMKNGDGPVVLVRTDLDALPVQEETGLPYASTRSEEHTSELQSRVDLVCRLLLEKKNAPRRRPLRLAPPRDHASHR